MSPEQQIQRGEHARRLLEDPLFKESMAEVKLAITESWASLPVENKAQAEELKRLLWAAKQFEALLEGHIAGAAFMQQELLMQSNVEIKRDAAKGMIYER